MALQHIAAPAERGCARGAHRSDATHHIGRDGFLRSLVILNGTVMVDGWVSDVRSLTYVVITIFWTKCCFTFLYGFTSASRFSKCGRVALIILGYGRLSSFIILKKSSWQNSVTICSQDHELASCIEVHQIACRDYNSPCCQLQHATS